MCSVQDSDVPLKKDPKDTRKIRLCMKCQEQKPILITRVNDAFCAACFQMYVTHKFRAAIGKTKLVRDGELVLVGVSGGPASSALLQLIQEGLGIRAHKKLRFKPGLIFIDEGATIDLPLEERLANCEKMCDIMSKTGFPFYISSLEEGLSTELLSKSPNNLQRQSQPTTTNQQEVTSAVDCDSDSVYSSETASVTLPTMSSRSSPAFRDLDDASSVPPTRIDGYQSQFKIYEDAENHLKETLKSLKTTSAKEEFIRILRHKILLEVGKSCGYTKVMLGNCGTQLAVRLLTDMSTGKGNHAGMETSFADKRHTDIMFLRPLRDFSSKEVAMYNNLHRVETVFVPSLTTKGAVDVSIEHLTESFVTGLQAEYPSTVSNIMRTGEKLDGSIKIEADRMCAMCQGPLDTNVGASSALSAVLFSQEISRAKKTEGFDNTAAGSGSGCCGEGDGQCQTNKTSLPSPKDVLANLCYGCRLVIKDMNDICYLPEYVLKDVTWRTRRMKMKEDIEDFLLVDS